MMPTRSPSPMRKLMSLRAWIIGLGGSLSLRNSPRTTYSFRVMRAPRNGYIRSTCSKAMAAMSDPKHQVALQLPQADDGQHRQHRHEQHADSDIEERRPLPVEHGPANQLQYRPDGIAIQEPGKPSKALEHFGGIHDRRQIESELQQ